MFLPAATSVQEQRHGVHLRRNDQKDAASALPHARHQPPGAGGVLFVAGQVVAEVAFFVCHAKQQSNRNQQAHPAAQIEPIANGIPAAMSSVPRYIGWRR